MPSSTFNFGQSMSQLNSALSRQAFEIQFQQLQKANIQKINDKIASLNDNPIADRKISELGKQITKLNDQLEPLSNYAFLNDANEIRYGTIQDATQQVQDMFGNVDADGNLSQETADAINAQMRQLSEELRRVREVSHPDMVDPGINKRVRGMADTLDGMTVTAGAVDGDNKAVLKYLVKVYNDALVGQTVSDDQSTRANRLSTQIMGKISEAQAEAETVKYEAYTKPQAEIEKMKEETALFLQSISLGYELQQSSTEQMINSMNGVKSPTGTFLDVMT
ncbi:hypothetical protein [Magnetospirillum aberrantis]|uniref:Flagellin n=1 Tax=Magnetospirillum aberrantis SpK TaxID=908842 RepID=A0A7C9UX76_9PROT|nr:hypothetical protein [Magnetospirillum aberrantis]NFV81189.1 hypothetical protein [Magnetospirillum aberrantis SpK]